MNWTRTILDGLIMAAYFNLFALAMVFYNPRLMLKSFPPQIIKAASQPLTEKEKHSFSLFMFFGELLPLTLYGAASSACGGTEGFWLLFLTGYIQWLSISTGDLLILDYMGIKHFKSRYMIPGAEENEMYEMQNWMKKYALPEHLLQWPLFTCPLMAAAQAGLALLFT